MHSRTGTERETISHNTCAVEIKGVEETRKIEYPAEIKTKLATATKNLEKELQTKYNFHENSGDYSLSFLTDIFRKHVMIFST